MEFHGGFWRRRWWRRRSADRTDARIAGRWGNGYQYNNDGELDRCEWGGVVWCAGLDKQFI